MEALVNFVFVYSLIKLGLVALGFIVGVCYGATGGTGEMLKRAIDFLK